MTQEELEQLRSLLEKASREDMTEPEESLYLPTGLPQGFYLGDVQLLRRLNTPSSGVFRRLLGIKG